MLDKFGLELKTDFALFQILDFNDNYSFYQIVKMMRGSNNIRKMPMIFLSKRYEQNYIYTYTYRYKKLFGNKF